MTPVGKLVCIVDDDENIRDMYQRKFVQSGFDIVTATNGEEGMQVIRDKRPDIVLLDIQMPIKDGVEVLKELKNDDVLKTIPVVVLSNLDDDGMLKKVGGLDATRFYLVKAFTTPQKAVDIVKEVLH